MDINCEDPISGTRMWGFLWKRQFSIYPPKWHNVSGASHRTHRGAGESHEAAKRGPSTRFE